MNAGPLLAYARWQARDALVRAIAPVAMFAAIAGIMVWGTTTNGIAELQVEGPLRDAMLQIYVYVVNLSMTLGALAALSGVVSVDRDRGYVRFLFSAPVSAWGFYLQRFVIGVVLFVALYGLVPVGFGLLVIRVPILPVVLSAALYAFLLGALVTLVGAITRKDGPVVIAVVVLAMLLQPIARAEAAPRWLAMLADLLPPLTAASGVRQAWLAGATANHHDLMWVIGYSAVLLVAALVIIRRAPLAR